LKVVEEAARARIGSNRHHVGGNLHEQSRARGCEGHCGQCTLDRASGKPRLTTEPIGGSPAIGRAVRLLGGG
jgi:hypothetical protein